MRITFGMLTDRVRDNLTYNSAQLLDAQNQASSGKRIQKPSDDVTGTSKAIALRSTLAGIDQFTRNSAVAKSNLAMTSSSMDSMVKGLQDIRRLTLQAATDTSSTESRNSILTQIDTIEKSLVSQANTQHMGKYIFAGGLSDSPAIVSDPTADPPYTYQGDNSQFNIQVGPGIYIPTTVTADTIFNIGGSAMPDQPDLFSTIETLRNEIKAGNVTATSNKLDEFDKQLNNVISIRSQVGARLSRANSTQDSLLDSKTVVEDLLSSTEDVDYAEAAINLKTRENLYNAALATAGRLMQTSLLDYIK